MNSFNVKEGEGGRGRRMTIGSANIVDWKGIQWEGGKKVKVL